MTNVRLHNQRLSKAYRKHLTKAPLFACFELRREVHTTSENGYGGRESRLSQNGRKREIEKYHDRGPRGGSGSDHKFTC
jgi:hypothetical protein